MEIRRMATAHIRLKRRAVFAMAVIALGVFPWYYGILLAKLAIGSAYVMRRVGTATCIVEGEAHTWPLFKPVYRPYDPERPIGLIVTGTRLAAHDIDGAIVLRGMPPSIYRPGFSDRDFARLPFGFALVAEHSLIGIGYDDGKNETRLETNRKDGKIVFTCYPWQGGKRLFTLEVTDETMAMLK